MRSTDEKVCRYRVEASCVNLTTISVVQIIAHCITGLVKNELERMWNC
jgi:hypothetical protein